MTVEIGHFRITIDLLYQSESWCSSFHMKISFNLLVNENSFSYERMTRFVKEAEGNSQIRDCECYSWFKDLEPVLN